MSEEHREEAGVEPDAPLQERLDASGLCSGPDVDVPTIPCGHPLPCPRHPHNLVEELTQAALSELDISHPSAPTVQGLRDRIRAVLEKHDA
jgi:hypothetical protein